MTTHKGLNGVVKVTTNAVAEVRGWEVTEKADTTEDTVMGDSWRSRKPTLKSFSGSLECFWDASDTNGQEALDVGSEVTLNLYPDGATSGSVVYSGSVIITEIKRNATLDGMVEAAFSFEGNGALTKSP